ncbi:MAG: acyl carrier protein [Kineosporiaceae bacterium]
MSDTATHTTEIMVLEFIRDRYPRAEVGPDVDIFGLGYVNSLFAMELVMFLEKTFAVRIPNDELRIDNFRTASSMAALVDRVRGVSGVSGTRGG